MKTLLRISLALLLLGGVVPNGFAASEIEYNEGLSVDAVSDIRKFRRVRNTDDASTSLVNGDVVVYDVRSATNTSLENRWSVTTTTLAADTRVAGVMAESVAPNRYGNMQVYGIHSAVRTTGDVVPHGTQKLETSTTAGRARAVNSASRAPLGAPLEAGTGTDTVHAQIDLD